MNPLKQRVVELEQICEMKEAHIGALTELLEQRANDFERALEYGKKAKEQFQELTEIANTAIKKGEELENKLILARGLIHRYENKVPTTLEEANAILAGSAAKVLQHIKNANEQKGDNDENQKNNITKS